VSNWVALPIVVPLATSVVTLLLLRRIDLQRWVSLAGAAALLGASLLLLARVESRGAQVLQASAWESPFGISLVADAMSALMLVLTGVMALMGVVYARGSLDEEREKFGFHPLLHAMLMGVCGAFLTGDLFNMFVWFEVMLISSFVLIALGGGKHQLEGALKYVAINLFASVVFLSALGLLYGATGTLNLADLALKAESFPEPAFFTKVSMLLLVTFAVKAGLAPFFFWLPASYHTPPTVISAVFAGLLAKVGIYAVLRVFPLLFGQDPGFTIPVLQVIAAVTMLIGVFGAFAQTNFRRILAFHSVSQMGYILMGFTFGAAQGIAASVFFILHHSVVKSNLFLISGYVRKAFGSEKMEDLGGLAKGSPWLAATFVIAAFSLAGFPPLSGFLGKLALVKAGLAGPDGWLVGVSLFVSVFTLLSMLKIWLSAFWSPAPTGIDRVVLPQNAWMQVPTVALAAGAVLLGVFARPVWQRSEAAAQALLDRNTYISAVLPNAIVAGSPATGRVATNGAKSIQPEAIP
jgi:multicomponent Na+:H+ antiporter subunit D